jgi:hypothetical protein
VTETVDTATQGAKPSEERDYLVKVLESTLKDARIEEHRTRTPSYREFVLNEEHIVEGSLTKLGHGPC